ncbi:MAG: ATP-dependent DNA helicase RecG [Holosporaceae bacterium]|jgi:ATP-dependent DNA helicase RecG|nr:ATP-dependent DNA helicase RecG [Holosporaceae bacterium]
MNHFLLQPFNNFLKLSEFTKKSLKKCCGGDRVIDLLFHFPISVQNRVSDVHNFSEKDKLSTVVKIIEHIPPRRKVLPYKIIGQTAGKDLVTILYFNYDISFIRKSLPIGGIFTISGSAQKTTEGIQLIHPDIIAQPSALKYHVGTEPIYPLVAKLSNHTLRYAIGSLLKIMPEVSDWIPDTYELPTFSESIRIIHNPRTIENTLISNPARRRIALDELLVNQIRLKQIRSSLSKQRTMPFQQTNKIIGNLKLPFELTKDQLSCLNDIKNDLASTVPMNRLIQGDVGAGKTVVALLSSLIVLENNYQTALLAPTEILSLQHFDNIRQLSKNLGIKVDIMLSSNRKIRFRQMDELKNGKTQILIGTHAILENEIEFKNLGLVVIDEQHRFGVLQRLALIKKCRYPNVLAMSATPIPRTLLLGCYGDLDVSTIKTKPQGRKPIETIVVNVSQINNLIKRLQGVNSQIYWVCPVIEESEDLINVSMRYDYLSNFFPVKEIFTLHGKMKPQEKEEIIRKFKNGEFKVLVSTTVIEVGVDIPNANVIVIEHAERFGLAQLHQLRGRVGRGSELSYCVLLYHNPVSHVGKQRLQLMKNTTDGFLISEEDLKLRGAGDILGKEQSGFHALRFSNFSSNSELIQIAEKMVKTIKLNQENIEFLYKIFSRLHEDIIA